jgi:hypothetical protein
MTELYFVALDPDWRSKADAVMEANGLEKLTERDPEFSLEVGDWRGENGLKVWNYKDHSPIMIRTPFSRGGTEDPAYPVICRLVEELGCTNLSAGGHQNMLERYQETA